MAVMPLYIYNFARSALRVLTTVNTVRYSSDLGPLCTPTIHDRSTEEMPKDITNLAKCFDEKCSVQRTKRWLFHNYVMQTNPQSPIDVSPFSDTARGRMAVIGVSIRR